MKKAFLCFVILLTTQSSELFSQSNYQATLKGYENKEYLFFDSLHNLQKDQLAGIDGFYEFYITFKVDTNLTIVDYKLIELPICQLPENLKKYFENLIKATNGKWSLKIEHSQKKISEEIIYFITLMKKNQTVEDFIKAKEKFIEYYFGIGAQNETINQFYSSANKKIIPLSF